MSSIEVSSTKKNLRCWHLALFILKHLVLLDPFAFVSCKYVNLSLFLNRKCYFGEQAKYIYLSVNHDLNVIPFEYLAISFTQVKSLSCLCNGLFVYIENQLAWPLWFPYLFSPRILTRKCCAPACFWHPPVPVLCGGLLAAGTY